MKLLRRDNQEVIHEGNFETMLELVNDAISKKISLSFSNFRYANLQNADFRYADLQNANLQNADLLNANLQNADLQNTDFRYADLQNTDFRYAKILTPNIKTAKIKNAMGWSGLYRYWVFICVTTENKCFVRMGCKWMSLEDWKANFWNNNDEFPNDGSPDSMLRKNAFEFAVNYAKINGWLKLETEL